MEQLNYAQVRDMLLYVAEQIIDSKALLTEVDSQIGDGDHGIGMERGMKKAKEKLLSMESGSNVYALFQEMGKTMLMSMGGASGVIFGTMFMGGAKGKPERSSLDGAALIELLEGSLAQTLAEREAAEAAREGMEATKNYQAKYGRAKSLMERALGHQDAGATSTWIIFRSMAEYVQKL